jgi:hypothetical protein
VRIWRRTVVLRGRPVLFAASLCMLVASPVAAQGNGHAYGHSKRGGGPSAAGKPEVQKNVAIAGSGVRNFGSWLDDASMLPVGQGALTLSFGYWRTPSFREWDVPTTDAAVALAPRVQVGVSVPYFHAAEPGGPVARGLGDLYLSAKVQLRDPSGTGRPLGFAVTPVLEVLSTDPAAGVSRYSWGLPVNVELQRERWRSFGSVGYFSRGSLFASAALEVALSERAFVSGTITQSHSIDRDDLSRALGFTQTRTDVSGALSTALNDTLTVYGAVGRTISKRDPNSSTLLISGGVSLNFVAWNR